MIIKDFKPYIGQHCETTTTGSLLSHIGLEYSEPLLFGIGEGLGYIFWNMKIMDFPFIGGRIKPDQLTQNICKNLNLKLEVQETSSIKKAWSNVASKIDAGIPVGLKLDCYHLEYFTTKIHFAGHYASIYGYDDQMAYLNDTNQQGRDAKTKLKNLALARNEKGPMSSKNLSYTISKKGKVPDLKHVVLSAILRNANNFLNPPIKNLGVKGIYKTSSELKKWFNSSINIKKDFHTSASIMERGGTGGSLFRNIYRDFLREAAELTKIEELKNCSQDYANIALMWKRITDLFIQIGDTKDKIFVDEAAELFIQLSEKEREVMEKLEEICSKNLNN